MKVYVVMGNDFPEAVFSGKETADQFCEVMRGKDRNQHGVKTNIYWRSYEFEVDERWKQEKADTYTYTGYATDDFGEGFG